MGATLVLDGESLQAEAAVRLAQQGGTAALSPGARAAMSRSHRQVAAWLREGGRPVYGINTGLGPLKGQTVPAAVQPEFQRRILLSHAAAVGEPLPEALVRLALLLRANVFARGQSGVRPALADRLLALVNRGVTPVVLAEGSVGLGDLPQMAQAGLAVAGMPEGLAAWQGETGSAPAVLAAAGLEPEFPLGPREALALVSGSTLTLALAVQAMVRFRRLISLANLAAALTMEALHAEMGALDSRIHGARPHPGQIRCADELRRCLTGSQWVSDGTRVQDAISLRCTAQVHGAAWDTLAFAEQVLGREINSSTDNPLLFPTGDEQFEAVAGGNSHGAHIAYVSDFLAIALADLCVLSDRRACRLLDPHLNGGLPPNLVTGEPGLNTGLVVAQTAATAMLAELRTLAGPASGGSLPGKSGQEDHVSMGAWAARKLLRALDLAEWVLAMEVLCACQAIRLAAPDWRPHTLGAETGRAWALVGPLLPAEPGDCLVHRVWAQVRERLRDGSLRTMQ